MKHPKNLGKVQGVSHSKDNNTVFKKLTEKHNDRVWYSIRMIVLTEVTYFPCEKTSLGFFKQIDCFIVLFFWAVIVQDEKQFQSFLRRLQIRLMRYRLMRYLQFFLIQENRLNFISKNKLSFKPKIKYMG